MITFHPYQIKEFGNMFKSNYYEGINFSCRFIKSLNPIYPKIYIPYGPIIRNELGINEFINWIKALRYHKLHIDLAYFENEEEKFKLINLLKEQGFGECEYIQDEKTIIIELNNYKISQNAARYIRKFDRACRVNILIDTDDIENQFDVIYKAYRKWSIDHGYKPRSPQAVKNICQNGYVIMAYNNFTDEFLGELICNVFDNVMYTVFNCVNHSGRNFGTGYKLRSVAFDYALENLKVKYIDNCGISSLKNRSYNEFKKEFGGVIVDLGGSFVKINE